MQRRQVLIIDGYKVIRNNERYSGLGLDYELGNGWNTAREALINDAAQVALGHYQHCTVVFDGAGNVNSTGEVKKEAGIDVIFSPAGKSADAVIEKLAFESRERGFEVVVVSSDFTIQSTVFGGGVTRMSAAGFGVDSGLAEAEWRQAAYEKANERRTIADRIDPDVLAKLEAMRDE